MEKSSINKILQRFEWKRLLRVCGGAHHGKIGEWIRRKSLEPILFEVVGVAEVEDKKEKWIDKVQSLKA